MASFFISYSRHDVEIANKIRNNIKQLDSSHDVFIDDKSIEVGSDFEEALFDTIRNLDYFILLLSENAIQSNWVRKEVKFVRDSEIKSGMKKHFICQIGALILPDFVPLDNQILKLTDNFCIDFYRLMAGINSKQSFFKVVNKIEAKDNSYDIDLWILTEKEYKALIHSVEYRFDHGFSQIGLFFKRVHLRKNVDKDYKISFWTQESVTIFVVIYLKNSKRINIIHKVEIGN